MPGPGLGLLGDGSAAIAAQRYRMGDLDRDAPGHRRRMAPPRPRRQRPRTRRQIAAVDLVFLSCWSASRYARLESIAHGLSACRAAAARNGSANLETGLARRVARRPQVPAGFLILLNCDSQGRWGDEDVEWRISTTSGPILSAEHSGWLTGFLAEEDKVDRRLIWRLGSWGVAAVGAVVVAILASQSQVQLRRDQVATSDTFARRSQQIQLVAKETQAEARRLTLAIETLNSDRDQLCARVTLGRAELDSVIPDRSSARPFQHRQPPQRRQHRSHLLTASVVPLPRHRAKPVAELRAFRRRRSSVPWLPSRRLPKRHPQTGAGGGFIDNQSRPLRRCCMEIDDGTARCCGCQLSEPAPTIELSPAAPRQQHRFQQPRPSRPHSRRSWRRRSRARVGVDRRRHLGGRPARDLRGMSKSRR